MKKNITIIIFITFSLLSINPANQVVVDKKNEYNGETIEVKFSAMEKNKYGLSHQIIFYDDNHNIKKVENYLTGKLLQEKQIIKQIEYYNNEIPAKYEIYFTDEYSQKTGINKMIEHMNDNDQVVRVESFYNDKLIIDEEDLNYYYEYPLLKLDFCNNYLQEAYKNRDKSIGVFIFIDAWYIKGRALVKYIKKTEELNEKDIEFIKDIWNKMFKTNIEVENKIKMLVKENDKEFWIIIDNSQISKVENGNEFLIDYNFGGYNTTPYFIVDRIKIK